MEQLIKTVVSGVLAYSIHYGCLKTYDHFCVPDGAIGFIRGLMTTGSPVCQTILSTVTQTQTSYSSLILLGLSRACIDMFTKSKEKEKDT